MSGRISAVIICNHRLTVSQKSGLWTSKRQKGLADKSIQNSKFILHFPASVPNAPCSMPNLFYNKNQIIAPVPNIQIIPATPAKGFLFLPVTQSETLSV